MRKILFRGQTRKYGEKVRMGDGEKLPGNWVYGGVLQGIGAHSVIYGGKNDDNFGEGFQKWCVYTDTLGQFTGLTDRIGKKIFEGDIVRDEYNGGIARIAFLQQGCGWYLVFKNTDRRMGHRSRNSAYDNDLALEVIGNIHDNPELMEVSNDGQ